MRLASKPLLSWSAKLRSFIGTWRMWVVVIALLSAFAGMAMGQMPAPSEDDSHTPKSSAGSPSQSLPGAETPGGAPGSDVSMEQAHKEVFGHVKGNPGGLRSCPWADNVVANLVVTLNADPSFVIESGMHITATGVTPPNPPLDLIQWLQRPEGASVFASCFIATEADLNSIEWSDGKLDAAIDLKWHDNPHAPIGYANDVIQMALHKNFALLTVDMCVPHPEWATGLRLTCTVGSQDTVVVRVRNPVRNLESMPFPASQQSKDGYFDTTWRFDGPMPRLTVRLDAPVHVLASSWLYWNRGQVVHIPGVGSASVDWYYIFDASAIWLALITAALLLRGKRSAQGCSSSRRLCLVIAAGLVLGVEIRGLGRLNELYSNGVIAIVTWAMLAVATSDKRRIPAIVTLSVLALVPFGWLAITNELQAKTVSLLQLWFSIALIVLVTAAAWALWTQIRALIGVADLDQATSTWRHMYRRLIDGSMIAVFMFGIGFPLGEILAAARSDYIFARLASDLVWSTGLLFRAPLQWISLLVAISYLADYLVNRRTAVLTPGTRREWHKVRWVRVANRAVAAVLALILCLSAPWTSQFRIGFLPVWPLQFGVLWLAFALLTANVPARRATSPDNPRKVHLLRAAIAAKSPEGSPTAHDDERDRTAATSVATLEPDPQATGRLLALGSQRGQLANAKSTAQVASIMAIVPVAYVLWSALREFGDRLDTSTGFLIVALLALVEFTRWVVTGFLFGYLYRKLPGRIGPVKALSFSAIWVLSCLGPLIVAQISSSGLGQQTIYRSAQFALFSIVLAVVVDLKAIRSATGTWRDLRKVYDLQNYGEVAAALAPAALLILTLGQQISAGSGAEVADTLLNGITSVLKGPI